jgi:methionyl-tRNA formyltransferase
VTLADPGPASTGPTAEERHGDLPLAPLAPLPRHPRRLVYFGTPEMAVAPLEALAHARRGVADRDGPSFEVTGVVTRVDKRRGRGGAVLPSPVKAAALRLGLPVLHRVDAAVELGADLGVVVAFGQLIRPTALARLPMVNLHFSLLPRWRGAAPVERALLAGDEVTGVCLMQVEHGLDTGGVLARVIVPIAPRATAAELRADLVAVGVELLVAQLRAGLGEPEAQSGEASYAAKIDAAELRIDWNRSAIELDRLIRVGGAWTTLRAKRIKVLEADLSADNGADVDADAGPGMLHDGSVRCGTGALRLLVVQPEGRNPMPFASFANGIRLSSGERLGESVDR